VTARARWSFAVAAIAMVAILGAAMPAMQIARDIRTVLVLAGDARVATRQDRPPACLRSTGSDAIGGVGEACQAVGRLRTTGQPLLFLLGPLGLVPGFGGADQIPALLDVTLAFCRAASIGQSLVRDLDATPGSSGERVLALTSRRWSDLRSLADELDGALEIESRLDERRFAGTLAPAGSVVRRLRALRPSIETARDAARDAEAIVGEALGANGPRTYLILGQNNEELRATGGFIGTIGVMTVDRGRIVRSDFRSSYDWDGATEYAQLPPAPLMQYMGFARWYLRDANWWIDYQESAREIRRFWSESQGDTIHGVIAVDRGALDLVLAALGGVDVPELGGFVTAAQATESLDRQRRQIAVQRNHAAYHETKTALLNALSKAIMARALLTPPVDALPAIAASLICGLETKHILLNFAHPEMAALISGAGWDGRVAAWPGDVLAIVDTSVSYGKTAPYLRKSGVYRRAQDGNVTLTVRYENGFTPVPGGQWDPLIDGTFFDWRAGVFRRVQGAWVGFVRILLPPDTTVDAWSGWDDRVTRLPDEGGLLTVGGPILVYPGEARLVTLSYRLPPEVRASPLKVLAQAGGIAYSLHVLYPSGPAAHHTIEDRDVVVTAG